MALCYRIGKEGAVESEDHASRLAHAQKNGLRERETGNLYLGEKDSLMKRGGRGEFLQAAERSNRHTPFFREGMKYSICISERMTLWRETAIAGRLLIEADD